MNWSEALSSAIEVAIAMAGFSGIVVAVGRRGAGDFSSADQLRLRVLLTASGVAGAFAFAPFILLDTGLEEGLVWRLGTAAQAVWFVGIMLYRRRQALQLGTIFVASPRRLVAIYLPAIALLMLNTAVLGKAWPYVLGVIVQLFIGFMTFVQLLLSSWRTET